MQILTVEDCSDRNRRVTRGGHERLHGPVDCDRSGPLLKGHIMMMASAAAVSRSGTMEI